ncbi:MAG: abortive phage resistance protein [Mesorhizobium sp.]|nr:MAG: abortive phage resistance protein [Mesorhizobium sp.]
MNLDDLPDSAVERARMLEGIMIAAATDGGTDELAYGHLRREFVTSDEYGALVPCFLRTHRDLKAFRRMTQSQFRHWHERREFIAAGFTPIMDHLEGRNKAPGDAIATDALQSFDTDGVAVVWTKALGRRQNDPEGAITVARTLLETVCKRILDDLASPYNDTDDLPKLYGLVAKELSVAPSQHTLEPIKAILGGAMNLVNGIGTLRNRMSDSHGRGGLPVKPSPRHASLAVNTAGAIATFLVETHRERSGS